MTPRRLWQRRGKCQKASDLSASVYGWLTAGFDIPDLPETRALLDELA